jgi:D-alanyl-D-alanine carboxypeptidase/D-alanyl-D-alanine-endopeptidase (penicillin-binding protein 4)
MVALAAFATGADLEQRIAAKITKAPGIVGVHVVDLSNGKVIYSRNADQLFLPASNMKLFTAALALTRLGPDARFETRLVREPGGALVLQGGGDPSLSGRVYPFSATAPTLPTLRVIDELAAQAVASGLTHVDGDIVGDDQRYPWSPYPESWTADDAAHDYGAPVSALTLNDNFVTIAIRPGTHAGDLARIELDPAFEYFAIDNRIATGSKDEVTVTRVPDARQLLLNGSIAMRTPVSRQLVAVDDPAKFAATAMYDALLRRGVAIHGRPVARHRIGTAGAEVDGLVLAAVQSPRLSEILQAMLKVSQNLHAEMLLREVGLARRRDGTVEAGLSEMQIMLNEFRVSPSDFRSEDGSGLARNDVVSPRAFTALLAAMDKSELRDLWRSLLPVSGEGTLNNRLCCVSETVVIRAKTGSLNRAIALSGYADSPVNGHLVFSILVNNFAAPAPEVRAWVDSVATMLIQ